MAKNELVSLALLTISPMHAYAISAVVEEMGIEHWAQVSRASLYAALGRLEKRGAIAVHTEKVDNMPERKVYSITPEGSAMFHEELHEAISKVHKNDSTLFHLGINFFIGVSNADGIRWAQERCEQLKVAITHIQQKHDILAAELCESGLISLRSALKIIAAELAATEEFISLLNTQPSYYTTFVETFRKQLAQAVHGTEPQ